MKRDTYGKQMFSAILKKMTPGQSKKRQREELRLKYSRKDQAPFHLALVLDDIVEDIIHCDERLGILLLSNPEIIEIRDINSVGIDWKYNRTTNKFYEE